MTHTTEFNHEFSNSEKKLSLKERFVKYITSRESAEVFNNALAAKIGRASCRERVSSPV